MKTIKPSWDLEWVETDFGSFPIVVVSREEWLRLNRKKNNNKPCRKSCSFSGQLSKRRKP